MRIPSEVAATAKAKLDEDDWKVDIALTHCAPSSTQRDLAEAGQVGGGSV